MNVKDLKNDIISKHINLNDYIFELIKNKEKRINLLNSIEFDEIDYNNLCFDDYLFYLSIKVLYYLENKIKYVSLLESDKDIFNIFLENEYKNISISNGLIKMFILGLENKNDCYEYFTKTMNVERSGWVYKPVPGKHLESIAEHMYEMVNIAKIYLPNTLDDPLYNKETIINMLLVHDIGETITGDIPHPNKKEDDDLKEDVIVRALLTSLMLSNSPIGITYYDAWSEWVNNNTINALIAHDLDVVQLNNQLLKYALSNEGLFTIEELRLWYRRRPITPLCIDIFNQIISPFPDRVKLFNDIMNK